VLFAGGLKFVFTKNKKILVFYARVTKSAAYLNPEKSELPPA
jgi:hypothetical protein